MLCQQMFACLVFGFGGGCGNEKPKLMFFGQYAGSVSAHIDKIQALICLGRFATKRDRVAICPFDHSIGLDMPGLACAKPLAGKGWVCVVRFCAKNTRHVLQFPIRARGAAAHVANVKLPGHGRPFLSLPYP